MAAAFGLATIVRVSQVLPKGKRGKWMEMGSNLRAVPCDLTAAVKVAVERRTWNVLQNVYQCPDSAMMDHQGRGWLVVC